MQSQTFNVAILGFGLSASVFHLPLICATNGLKLTHILSRQKAKINQLDPSIMVVNDLDAILNDPTIDLLINTLPNDLHYSITKECLNSGKHVVVEKPFVLDSTQGQELIGLAKQNGLLLSVYHNRRWDNAYLTLQQEMNKLGKIYLYEAYFDRYRPQVNLSKWRESAAVGSGILYDLGAHLLDQALNLFGKPQSLIADLAQQRNNAQTTDYFQLLLIYENMRVILGSSSLCTAPRPVIAAYGEHGSYVKYGLDPQENMLRLALTPASPDYGMEAQQLAGTLVLSKDQQLVSQLLPSVCGDYPYYYRQIYQALLDNSLALPVSAQSGLAVIAMIEAAYSSYSLGKRIDF